MIRDLCVGRHLALRADGNWEYAERIGAGGGVAILAFTEHDEILLVEQFRPPVHCRVISLPAGLVGDGEAGEKAAASALRELEEETAHRAESVTCLTRGPSSPGLTSEMMTFFLAHGVHRIDGATPDEAEGITCHLVPRAKLFPWLAAREAEGLLIDYKIFALLHLADRETKR